MVIGVTLINKKFLSMFFIQKIYFPFLLIQSFSIFLNSNKSMNNEF